MSSEPPPPPSIPSWDQPGQPGQPLEVGAAVSYAWAKFQQHAGALILIALVIALANLIGFAISLVVEDFFVALMLQIVFFIIGQILTVGIINASLMVTRGETPELGKVFATERLGPFIIASILYGIAIFVGLVLCIIPGIIAAFMLSFYGFYVLDQNAEPVAALSASFNLVKDNFGIVFLIVLVAFVINFIGAALCGIGLLVTAPICWIILGYAYRRLNNQSVAP
jgi:uncharacterized membrane protein